MSWEITCFERVVQDPTTGSWNLDTEVYVAVIEGESIQDAHLTAAIMKKKLHMYKKLHPDVTKGWLRSDCAG